MERGVVVSAPSRLHFGIVNPFNKRYRLYVSAGVAIGEPRTVVYIKKHEELGVKGPRGDEVLLKIRSFANKYGLKGLVDVKSTPPKHVGLGSTTQLLLSVTHGLMVLNNVDLPVERVAHELGLGRISAVGVYVFKYGGFVVDTGISKNPVPRLFTRLDFPEDWRFIVLIPPGSGLRDSEEKTVFSGAHEAPDQFVWRSCFYLFHELIPSLLDRDFESFSNALGKLQESVGEVFAEHQDGVFAQHCVKAVEILKKNGVVGVGQSSWGPAVYGVVASEDDAVDILTRIKREFNGSAFVAKPDNKGALISWVPI